MINSVPIIEKLSNASGVSGFEDEVVCVAKNYLADDFQMEEDRIRNLFIHPPTADSTLPRVMLDAHSDEVGFMVQSINSCGTLRFLPLGGWNPQALSAHAVRIRNTKGQWINGVIASTPTHFLTPEKMKKPLEIANMVIDIGATSMAETQEKFHISVGAPIVPDVTFRYDKKNDLLFGKALDDRLGCAALLEVMKHRLDQTVFLDVWGVLSTQEELGLRGVSVAVRKANPDIAIALEGTPADDTFTSPDGIQAALRKGPQIRHMDRSVLCNPRFVQFAIQVAQKNKIPFQEAVRSGGGNNGSVITLHDRGIPTITIGIPVRYIHSHHCIATLTDFNAAVNWCAAILSALDRKTIESF